MNCFNGTVSKIRILKYEEEPLVRFTLDDTVNCLIKHDSLNFIADVGEGTSISVYGHYNSRKQFIIHKYAVLGATKIQYFFEKSNYPSRNK